MSQTDEEIMHLTAESTGWESSSLVTQRKKTALGEIKIRKGDGIKGLPFDGEMIKCKGGVGQKEETIVATQSSTQNVI